MDEDALNELKQMHVALSKWHGHLCKNAISTKKLAKANEEQQMFEAQQELKQKIIQDEDEKNNQKYHPDEKSLLQQSQLNIDQNQNLINDQKTERTQNQNSDQNTERAQQTTQQKLQKQNDQKEQEQSAVKEIRTNKEIQQKLAKEMSLLLEKSKKEKVSKVSPDKDIVVNTQQDVKKLKFYMPQMLSQLPALYSMRIKQLLHTFELQFKQEMVFAQMKRKATREDIGILDSNAEEKARTTVINTRSFNKINYLKDSLNETLCSNSNVSNVFQNQMDPLNFGGVSLIEKSKLLLQKDRTERIITHHMHKQQQIKDYYREKDEKRQDSFVLNDDLHNQYNNVNHNELQCNLNEFQVKNNLSMYTRSKSYNKVRAMRKELMKGFRFESVRRPVDVKMTNERQQRSLQFDLSQVAIMNMKRGGANGEVMRDRDFEKRVEEYRNRYKLNNRTEKFVWNNTINKNHLKQNKDDLSSIDFDEETDQFERELSLMRVFNAKVKPEKKRKQLNQSDKALQDVQQSSLINMSKGCRLLCPLDTSKCNVVFK